MSRRVKKLKSSNELFKGKECQNNKIFIRPKLEARNQSQVDCIRLIKEKDIIFIGGPAGSGKSFISVIMGLLEVIKGNYERLVLIRPAVTTEEIGLLPGTIEEKVVPFLEPMLEIIYKFVQKEEFEQLRKDGKIQVKSMAYLRGLTLDNAFIVVDEAQNLTDKAMKLIITRIGENTKLVIQGDEEQSDLKYHDRGSLARHIELFENYHDKFGSFRFKDTDIVRSPLITVYLNRIKNAANCESPKQCF